MNIRTNEAGYVKESYFESKGFKVFEIVSGNDMGQMEYELPQYSDGTLKILGGYWNYYIKDNEDNLLWEGWWNSNEEFDQTIEEIKNKLKT